MESNSSKCKSHVKGLLKGIIEKLSDTAHFTLSKDYSVVYKKTNPLKCTVERNAMYKLYYANQMLFNCLIDAEKYDRVYDLLADEKSKKVFDWVLQYKITFAFDEELAEAIYTQHNFGINNDMIIPLGESKFKIKGYCIQSSYNSIYESWVLQEYFHRKCMVRPNDIVISGGAYNGESSIWFADHANQGKIYAFEPSKASYAVLCDNVKNNALENRIIPINSAISGVDGKLYFELDYDKQDGPGSICVSERAEYEIDSTSIDTFVRQNKIEKVDFIKLDIEG